MTIGPAGWVRFESEDLPGPLYVRLVKSETSRWVTTEIYLDGSDSGGQVVTPELVRRLPLASYESLANDYADELDERLTQPTAMNLSTMASYFNTTFGTRPGVLQRQVTKNWVAMAYASRLNPEKLKAEGLDLDRPKTKRDPRGNPLDTSYRLTQGPIDGINSAFLRNVARAYMAALGRGERPNKAIFESLNGSYKKRTVEHWVLLARQQGYLPQTRKGATG